MTARIPHGHKEERDVLPAPDLGEMVVVLLAGALAGLGDTLRADGFEPAADLVGDLVEIVDDYLTR